MQYFGSAITLFIVTVTTIGAELCVTGPITLTLKGRCHLDTITKAYSELFNNVLLKVPNCENTLQQDLAVILGDPNLSDGAAILCASADRESIPFSNISGSFDSNFDKTFFDGGTYWNEEVETELETTGDVSKRLKTDAARIKRIYNGPAQYATLEWPESISNFDLDSCDIHAAMCCWSQDRQADDNNGNCNTPYDQECIDKDPADNTDLCAVNLDKASASTKIGSNGIMVHPEEGGESAVHCHGLAWSNDLNDASARYKGNNLFFISMYDHMHKRGYVRNIQGAPMCACVEQMPIVTRADCTQTDVEETFEVIYDPNISNKKSYSVKLTNVEVEFNSCEGLDNRNNDLSAYVARLHDEGRLNTKQKAAMKEILVENGNCRRSQERNLARAGIVRGFADGEFEYKLQFPETDTNEFVHGLCVVGASSVSAFSSDFDLYYKAVDTFSSGQLAWGDRDYVYQGVENTTCAGGIYLQPSRHKTINRYTDITIGANPSDTYVTICGFVEHGRRHGNWVNQISLEKGFNTYIGDESGLNWVANEKTSTPMSLLCKEFPERPSLSPSTSPPTDSRSPLIDTVSLTLPATLTTKLVHGICVKGANYAVAQSPNTNGLFYTPLSDFRDGVMAWKDRKYIIEGVNNMPCAGGIFLQPSKHKKIGKNSVITIEAERDGSNYMTVCVFTEPGSRNGGWFETLPTMGFTNYDTSFEGFKWGGSNGVNGQIWGTLCKDI